MCDYIAPIASTSTVVSLRRRRRRWRHATYANPFCLHTHICAERCVCSRARACTYLRCVWSLFTLMKCKQRSTTKPSCARTADHPGAAQHTQTLRMMTVYAVYIKRCRGCRRRDTAAVAVAEQTNRVASLIKPSFIIGHIGCCYCNDGDDLPNSTANGKRVFKSPRCAILAYVKTFPPRVFR